MACVDKTGACLLGEKKNCSRQAEVCVCVGGGGGGCARARRERVRGVDVPERWKCEHHVCACTNGSALSVGDVVCASILGAG